MSNYPEPRDEVRPSFLVIKLCVDWLRPRLMLKPSFDECQSSLPPSKNIDPSSRVASVR